MKEKDKIRVMAKLAVYDKHMSAADRKVDRYFRQDYIYKRGIGLRISTFIGCLIAIFLYYCYRAAFEELDILTMDYQSELIRIVTFVVAMLAVYTIVGAIRFSAEYDRAERRIGGYFKLASRLDTTNQLAKKNDKGKVLERESHGAINRDHIKSKRNAY